MENKMQIFENKEHGENQLVLDSREVAEMVGKRHANLIRDIDHYIEVLSQNSKLSSDSFFIEKTYVAGTGKQYKRYDITRKGCEMAANKLTGEKGILFTAEYVERFNQMEKELMGATPMLPDFTNPAEAARAWANEYEAKQKLLGEVKMLAPKAEFYDTVASSESLLSMGEAAKTLNMGIGRNNLFALLRFKGILNFNNIPYQRFVNAGYFKLVEKAYDVNDEPRVATTTYVTQKGLDYIRKILLKEGYHKKLN